MERKKLINRMLLVAIVIGIAALIPHILEEPYVRLGDARNNAKRKEKIAKLTGQYQKYLDETAAKITDVTINPQILSEIKSYIFREMSTVKLYLWMSDVEGNFLFGIPAPVFTRLNKGYDRYRNILEKRGHVVDRNDFLLKVVHRHAQVKFSLFEPRGGKLLEEELAEAEYFSNEFDVGYLSSSPNTLNLSAPVIDENKQVLGDLYLKVYDPSLRPGSIFQRGSLNRTLYEALHVVLGISALFIWFLLPTWVYIDARERDVKNVVLWVVLTVISFGFAFIIYLIVRPQAQKAFLCPDCQQELNGTKAFCPYCGFDLSSTFCPQCQYPIKPDWQFCPSCRFDMKQKAQVHAHDEPPEQAT
jgi:RNA polymerase subunit RPABC4/transcription elongation factor Spt4